jgi:hypothetical protein
VLVHQRLEFRDQLGRPTASEVGVDPRRRRHELELVEAGDVGRGECSVVELGERWAAPQVECVAEHRGCHLGVGRETRSTGFDEALESERVDPLRRHVQEVASWSREQDRAVGTLRSIGLERGTEPRDRGPERPLSIGVGRSPDGIDQSIDGVHDARLGEERREQRSATWPAEIDRLTVAPRLQLPEHPELQGGRGAHLGQSGTDLAEGAQPRASHSTSAEELQTPS